MWLMDGTRRIRLAMACVSKGWEECHHNKTKIKRHSFMVWDCWQAPEDSVSHGLWKKGWKECHTKIKWEPLFEGLSGKGVRVPTTIRWQQQTPLKILLLLLSICFQNQSSSANIAIDAFPLWRTILLLLCWVSSPISLHLKKQTLVWTVHWFLHTCILHLLYYSMLTISMRYTCYKLKATADT